MAEKDANRPIGVAQSAAKRAGAPAQRSPSIKDIARLAHVSHPTVSRALQNSPLVNAETAAKIRRIAQEQGYRASAVARGLVTRRTRTIALITMLDDPASSEVTCGIEEAANDLGYAAFLANMHEDPERQHRVIEDLAEHRVDGIILTSARVSALYLPLLSGLNVPVVLVNDHHPGEPVHTVSAGNQEAMRARLEPYCTQHALLMQISGRRLAGCGGADRRDRRRHERILERLSLGGLGGRLSRQS